MTRGSVNMSDKYWYNVTSGEVEFGRLSQSVDRVGPFDTREEAANALDLLKKRAQDWAEEDAREN